jgi:hypothetical protein
VAEVSDFVVVLQRQFAGQAGKWKSEAFATGARNILRKNGVELKNAYVMLNLLVPPGSPDANIRIIVNDNPLPQLVLVGSDSQRSAFATFPASFLNDGGGNHIELHAQGEHRFGVQDAVVHFRQNA